jgi:large subunit ribosomal protein L10
LQGFLYVVEATDSAWKGDLLYPMPTPRKEAIVAALAEKLGRSKAVVLVQSQGLSVAEQNDLRKKLRTGGLDFQVVKNTLFRLAARQANIAAPDSVLTGPTAAAIGYDEEPATAKTVLDSIKSFKVVSVKAGILRQVHLNAAQVDDLSKLPGRNELRAQAVGTVQGPLTQAYGVLNAPLRDLVGVLRNYAEKQGGTF